MIDINQDDFLTKMVRIAAEIGRCCVARAKSRLPELRIAWAMQGAIRQMTHIYGSDMRQSEQSAPVRAPMACTSA